MSGLFSLLTREDELVPSEKLAAEATMTGNWLNSKRFEPTPGKK